MIKPRRRLCRAIGANAGLRAAYRARLLGMMEDYQAYVAREIMAGLDGAGLLGRPEQMAGDAAFKPQSKEERETAKKLRRAMLTRLARQNPGATRAEIEKIVKENLPKWQAELKRAAMGICDRFVRKLALSVTGAQYQAFKAAGINQAVLAGAWTVPTVGRQSMSAAAAEVMPEAAQANAALITRIGAEDVERISGVLSEGLTAGLDYEALRETLRQTRGFDEARANRVVIDQTNKLSQQIQTANARAVGCERGVWVHVPGQYTSREEHIEMDGREFDLAVGMFDPVVRRNVMPGELPFCRCIFRAVFPAEIVGGDDDES